MHECVSHSFTVCIPICCMSFLPRSQSLLSLYRNTSSKVGHEYLANYARRRPLRGWKLCGSNLWLGYVRLDTFAALVRDQKSVGICAPDKSNTSVKEIGWRDMLREVLEVGFVCVHTVQSAPCEIIHTRQACSMWKFLPLGPWSTRFSS